MNTAAQQQSDLITQKNIAKLRAVLGEETNEAKRAGLEKLLAEQLDLLTRMNPDGVS